MSIMGKTCVAIVAALVVPELPLAVERPAPDLGVSEWLEESDASRIGKIVKRVGGDPGDLGDLEDLLGTGGSRDELASYHGRVVVVHTQTHAKLIDNDVKRFDVETLRAWKKEAEECAAENVGKPQSQNNAVNDLQLFEMTVKAYKEKGTPKYFLDAQNLTNEQKADLFDRAILSKKGRYPKSNPYKKNG